MRSGDHVGQMTASDSYYLYTESQIMVMYDSANKMCSYPALQESRMFSLAKGHMIQV
jgi:hypothetical protein